MGCYRVLRDAGSCTASHERVARRKAIIELLRSGKCNLTIDISSTGTLSSQSHPHLDKPRRRGRMCPPQKRHLRLESASPWRR